MKRKQHRRLGWIVPLLVPILLATLPLDLAAQQQMQMVRTLVIRDNQVLIDGREVAQDSLPPNMDFDGVNVSYSFVGIEFPVVTISDQFFAVLPYRLQPIESRDQRQAMMRQDRPREWESHQGRGLIVDSDRGEFYTFQGERLGVEQAVPRLLNEANALYLEDLQKQNGVLYSRLSRERELEHEAELLALAARRSTSRADLEKHRMALTEKLTEIFELKQQNRRDEITQFENELDLLKRRVEKRDELKKQIVEERVKRLTNTGR